MLLDVQSKAERPALDSLAMSDREDALTDWLDEHAVSPKAVPWRPRWRQADLPTQSLEALVGTASRRRTRLREALAWLGTSLEAVELLQTVEQSADRISDLVQAIKDYSYMDQAPQQEVDVQQSLETTLTILRFKWKHGVEIVRDYAPDLPCITAYGSELNQVWTNLMDNALDALDGKGHLFVRTAQEDEQIARRNRR